MTDCSICIVEPDEIEREILEGILAEEGKLKFYKASKELLADLSTVCPALIIMEKQFGAENGYDVCRIIKEDYSQCDTSVLFLTTEVSVDERLKGLEAGADDYLTKPYDIIEFAAKIQAARNRITKKAGLRAQLNMASNTAMQAMSAQSEMGSVLQSVRAMNEASDFDSVCDGLFVALRDYGLKCTVFFNQMGEDMFMPTPGRQATPIEQEIINMVRDKERVWQREKRACFNFPNSSLLVLNMPDDEDRAGRLRDSLCLVMEAYDVRINNLNQYKELMDAQEWQSSVKEISQLLNVASNQLQGSIGQSHQTLKKLVDELFDLLPRLGLEEDQEDSIHYIVDDAFAKLSKELEQTETTRAVFGKVLAKLNKM